MKPIDISELVRTAYKKAVRKTSLLRLERYKKQLQGGEECPFYRFGMCENPLNPEDSCTEDPKDCPYLNKLLVNTQPIPAFLVPVKVMHSRGLIRLYMDEKNKEIIVKPGDSKYATYVTRAAMLLEMALQIYGEEGRKVRETI